MPNEDHFNHEALANANTETSDELGHIFNTTLPDIEGQVIAEEMPATDNRHEAESGDLVGEVMAATFEATVKDPTIIRADAKREAKDAIALYNESGGLTPLELAIALAKKPEHDVSDYKNPLSAMKTKVERIAIALYKARIKGLLALDPPEYDACYLSELKDTVLSGNNGFESDTAVKIEFKASKTDGPIDSFIVTRL